MKKFEKKKKTGVANTDEGHCIVTETFDTNLNLVVRNSVGARVKEISQLIFILAEPPVLVFALCCSSRPFSFYLCTGEHTL